MGNLSEDGVAGKRSRALHSHLHPGNFRQNKREPPSQAASEGPLSPKSDGGGCTVCQGAEEGVYCLSSNLAKQLNALPAAIVTGQGPVYGPSVLLCKWGHRASQGLCLESIFCPPAVASVLGSKQSRQGRPDQAVAQTEATELTEKSSPVISARFRQNRKWKIRSIKTQCGFES